MAQEVITLVDITRSSDGKVFETELYKKQYDKLKAAGKLKNWRLKSDIDSITTEEVEEEEEAVVEIVQLEEEETQKETVLDYNTLSLAELKAECKKRGIKFHHASKEPKLISLLEEA